MEEFPGNSQRQRRGEARAKNTPAKNVERIVDGKVMRRKKPFGRRLRDMFLGSEGSIWEFIKEDILIPALQDTTHDVITQGAERAIFRGGDYRGSRGRRGRRRGGGPTDYNRYSRDRDRDEPRRMSRRGRANFDFDEIILESRAEAEDVLDHLFELLSNFDMVTVADLYDLIGIQPEYTDRNYGWFELQGVGIDRITGGYLLDLPRPEPINSN